VRVNQRKLDSITPYPGNPRINDAGVAAVAASIREFGFRQPIVVDADGVIICGHTRYRAAQELGLETVPVHVAKDLSPEQVKAYRLADNKSAEMSTWDYDLLPIELADLQATGFDMDVLGFEDIEIERLIGEADTGAMPENADGTEYDETAADHLEMQECPNCGHKYPKE